MRLSEHILWKMWGVTSRGPQHEEKHIPNQDSFTYRYYSWGEVAVVSDGVGSCALSHFGSRALCLSVIEEIENWADKENIDSNKFISKAHQTWLNKVKKHGASNCSATCLFVIRTGNMLTIGHLGDGVILVFKDDLLQDFLCFEEEKEESFSNITDTITEKLNIDKWRIHRISIEECHAIFLCTDGISESTNDLVELLREIFKECSSMHSLDREHILATSIKKYFDPINGDDKTIVCMHQKRYS